MKIDETMKLRLDEIELVSESFENNKVPFENLHNTKVKISGDLKVGIITEKNNEDNKRLAITLSIKTKVSGQDNTQMSAKMEITNIYIFVNEDKDNNIINDIIADKYTDEEKTQIMDYAVSLAYPYTKEQIESVFKKANINISLPLNIRME